MGRRRVAPRGQGAARPWRLEHLLYLSRRVREHLARPEHRIRGTGTKAWFGWPTDPEMEALRDQWFEAPDLAAQQKIVRDMQIHFWQNPSYVPLGMYDQPMAFHSYLQDVRDGWPQFYGVRRV